LFLLEVVVGILAPIALLLNRKIRESTGGLYISAVLVLLGFVTNRLNVSITGMEASAGLRYIPKWTEVAVTASIIALAFAIFALAAKYLPIFPPAAARREAPRPAAPELVHART
jgi:Ni/Fe-hydrogenase subunit HybB-like protein